MGGLPVCVDIIALSNIPSIRESQQYYNVGIRRGAQNIVSVPVERGKTRKSIIFILKRVCEFSIGTYGIQ